VPQARHRSEATPLSANKFASVNKSLAIKSVIRDPPAAAARPLSTTIVAPIDSV
jgi:hypothetical protein